MDPEIERRGDDEDASRSSKRKTSSNASAHLEDVLERFDAEHRAGRSVGQADRRDVFDAIDAGPRPHVAADVSLSGKQPAQVGVTLLALDLVRAKLEDRAGTVELLGHQAAERLVVVAHRGLLLEPGWCGRVEGVVETSARTGSTPPANWIAADHRLSRRNGQGEGDDRRLARWMG